MKSYDVVGYTADGAAYAEPEPMPESFFDAYVECALWSSTDNLDEDGSGGQALDENFGPDDFLSEATAKMREDCDAFWSNNYQDLKDLDASQSGHDFWLTRNRHGAGFWDRGLGEVGTRLTDAAHVYGSVDIYLTTTDVETAKLGVQ